MEVWVQDFTPPANAGRDELIYLLEKKKLLVKKWSADLVAEIGLVFMQSSIAEESIIHFLRGNAKDKGHRVVIINFHEGTIGQDQLLMLFDAGAEYVFEYKQVNSCLATIADKIERWRNINSILLSPVIKKMVAGNSLALKKLLREIVEVAMFSSVPVLVGGERGTGKELVARLIHELDTRNGKSGLIIVDCTTLRKELAGSELFGHERGAFTGAENMREGAFALAHGGTLFLDEIGDLPLNLQAELLRIIQEGTYKKLGSNTWKHTAFRLVAATNRDLKQEALAGNFREDLYDRISVYNCLVPSLKERKEDIPELVNFFLHRQFGELPFIDRSVLEFLYKREYPGNIRELKNVIARIGLRYSGAGPVTLGDVMLADRPVMTDNHLPWYQENTFADSIRLAVQQGYDMKAIEEIVKDQTMKTAMGLLGKTNLVSEALGVSDRWVQQRKKGNEELRIKNGK